MNEQEKLLAARQHEKNKLGAAIDAFAEEMKSRAFQKADEGYTGWDVDNWDICLRVAAENSAIKGHEYAGELDKMARKSVDLANFAMFLHHRATSQGDGADHYNPDEDEAMHGPHYDDGAAQAEYEGHGEDY